MVLHRGCAIFLIAGLLCLGAVPALRADQTIDHPFLGVTRIFRTETQPRAMKIIIIKIDLGAAGLSFRLTPPGGTLETVRQTTLEWINQQRAQLAMNVHFFLPFPSTDPNSMLIGIAASDGRVFSAFEDPVQNYALVKNVPGLNIDASNRAGIVRHNPAFPDGKGVQEPVTLWTTVSGSAQTVTNGVKTLPCYLDAANAGCPLIGPGPANYSNSNSWYNLVNSRAAIGLSQDNRTLFLFTVDSRNGSLGMTVGEVADLLINDYGVYNALNLDGGGSTTMTMEDPATGTRSILNTSADSALGRAVGSNLAVFAGRMTGPATTATFIAKDSGNGWYNTPVTVDLRAAAGSFAAVKQIDWWLSGAQSQAPRTVPGNSATITVAEDGVSTLSYAAADSANSQEATRSLTLRIDRTAPRLSGIPEGDCTLWPPSGKLVTVARVAASDALSGMAANSLRVTVTSNEGSAADPDVVLTSTAGGTVRVQLRARNFGAGDGRVYTIAATATDRAGNVNTSSQVCTVPLGPDFLDSK